MKTLLRCEYLKTRRRFLLPTALGITVVQLLWALSGSYTQDTLRYGWMLFLYQFPLYNTLFLPVLAVVVSSRLCDLEHKGTMLKQLCVLQERTRIYDAKLLYGLGIMMLSILVSFLTLLVFGTCKGFQGEIPVKWYLLYLVFTIVPTIAIYIFQHTLSLLFSNQAVTFFVGIIGEFLGMFAMFLPQLPVMRKALPWGYYGVLQFVGMYGWTKETRMSAVYFEIMEIDWVFFGIMIVVSIGMYLIGRKLFCSREM